MKKLSTHSKFERTLIVIAIALGAISITLGAFLYREHEQHVNSRNLGIKILLSFYNTVDFHECSMDFLRGKAELEECTRYGRQLTEDRKTYFNYFGKEYTSYEKK